VPGLVLAAIVAAGVCVAASPYLARVSVTVPDREDRTWWRGAPPARSRTLWTAMTAAGFGALAGCSAGWGATLPALIALAVVSTPLAVIDFEVHRLPDRLVGLGAIAAAALLAIAAAVRDDWPAYLRAGEAAAVVFAASFAIAFVAPNAFGFGDVKLGAVLGAYLGWIGWPWVYYGILAGFLIGSAVGVVMIVLGRAGRKTPIPFGPALIAGTLVVLVLASRTL
jgi:leader peptidase (prepilin peptidase) / N-methyltransferase